MNVQNKKVQIKDIKMTTSNYLDCSKLMEII